MNNKKHLWTIVMTVALASALLVACGGGTLPPPTPIPSTPVPAATPTPSASEHMDWGLDYHEQGKLDEASAEFREALRLDPDYAPAHAGLAMIHYDQGRLDQAMAECRKTLGLDPDSEVAHYILGRAHYDQDNLVAAIAEYEGAIQLAPDYDEAHFNLGIAYAAQDRWDDAAAEWEETINLNPDFAEAHYNLGLFYTNRDSDRAITAFQEAIRLDPDHAKAYFKLGLLYSAQDRFDEAIAEYEEAIRLDPDYAEAHKFLGLEYAMQGRVDEAVAELETYLRLQPDASDRTDMEQIIAELEGPAAGQEAEYRNAAGGYSLRYPEGWHYKEQGSQVTFAESEDALETGIEKAPMVMFTAGPLDEMAESLGLEALTDPAESLEAIAGRLDAEPGEVETGQIAGYQAALTSISGTMGDTSYGGGLAIVLVEERGILATGLALPDQWDDFRPTFIDMLNSLSFFEPQD